jgi:hypothetical protein
MATRNAIIALLSTLLAMTAAHADDPKARDIMTKVDARDDGDKRTSDMQMILIDRNGAERVRTLRSWTKDMGADTYRIMFFLDPADVKDTGFLTYDYDAAEKDDDQWLYLPALRKSKRIAAADKSGSFMGSDFNYSDMTQRNLADYDFTLQKETAVEGHSAWIIEAVPRSQKVIDEIGYTKSLLIVRQDNFVVIRAVNWEKNGNLKYMDVRKLELIDNIWTPTEIHMTTKRGKDTEHKTVLKFMNTRYNQPMSDDLFTVRQLEKGQ